MGHDSWTFKDGAPADVTCLAQTNDGFLWLGSPEGLFRFDGTRFEPFSPLFGDRLLSTNVYSLFAPPSGGLWIGYTSSGGFSFLDKGRVTNYASETGGVRRFAQDRDGIVAARHIAAVVKRQNPTLAIHLGDIYYGGVRSECETFLQLWPLQTNSQHPEVGIPPGTSFALNGNHEMYSGGGSYFSIVLKAFGQPQPFFCLENDHWRLIGLDTAYADGRLNPDDPNDPIKTQWKWLIEALKDSGPKKNILLTHHQPVSAHTAEFHDSEGLRKDAEELLATKGIGKDAIFGWFFGHEHRCAIYKDTETCFNARLIGNGCIPHEVQTEKAADPGCTPIEYVNRRQDKCNSGAAVSMCVMLTFSDPTAEILIEYIDEDFEAWGTEVWNAQKGRLGGGKFQEQDFDKKLVGGN